MGRLINLVTSVGALLGSLANVQEASEPRLTPSQQTATAVAKLRLKAANVDTADLSKLFSVLRDPKKKAALALSKNQFELASRLEQLTRDIIKAWLLRELDSVPPPPTEAQLGRLSEYGDRVCSSGRRPLRSDCTRGDIDAGATEGLRGSDRTQARTAYSWAVWFTARADTR